MAEVMFPVGEMSWSLLIFLLDVLICNLVEVDEAMFLGLERPCEFIFYILGVQKATWT
jgi:hypothetical protein